MLNLIVADLTSYLLLAVIYKAANLILVLKLLLYLVSIIVSLL